MQRLWNEKLNVVVLRRRRSGDRKPGKQERRAEQTSADIGTITLTYNCAVPLLSQAMSEQPEYADPKTQSCHRVV
jgi:hypothetical protein